MARALTAALLLTLLAAPAGAADPEASEETPGDSVQGAPFAHGALTPEDAEEEERAA